MSSYGYLKQEMTKLKEENEQLHDEVNSLRQYLESLQILSMAINDLDPGGEIMPLLRQMLMKAVEVVDAKDGSLLVMDEETEELVFVLVHGSGSPDWLINQRIPPGKGIAGWVAQNKEASIVNNTQTDTRFYADIDKAVGYTTNSVLAAPIIGERRVLGVIELLNKSNGRDFNEADRDLLAILCRFAGEMLLKMLNTDEQSAAAPTA